jgi:antitoxin YefM
MTTITATDARSNLFQLIQKTIREHSPARISSKAGTAILISEEDFDSIMETAELMSEPGFLKSIKESEEQIKRGEVYTMEQVFGAKK